MTREQELRLKAALETAFDFCDSEKIRVDETPDPFRVTRAVLTAMMAETAHVEGAYDDTVVVPSEQTIEAELAALRERGARCDDAEVLLNCRLGESPPVAP